MTIAIGIVMTDHIVAGRLEDQRLTGKLLRYPEAADDLDALSAIPGSELVEMLAAQILPFRFPSEPLSDGPASPDTGHSSCEAARLRV